jgi:general stress protein YciG
MDSKEMGRRGGRARAKSLSAEKRREIASKAGKASGRARKKKARRKKNNRER